jgi:hypothetical protein
MTEQAWRDAGCGSVAVGSTALHYRREVEAKTTQIVDSLGAGSKRESSRTAFVNILQLDETAKIATIEWVDNAAPAYSMFGGSARLLQNGNVEFDECGLTLTGANTFANQSAILEATKTTTPQTVWQMQISGNYAYRAFRIPSLYPGVQW